MRTLLVALALTLTTAASAAERPLTKDDAKALFARLQSLAGTWKSKSTKGWTESSTYEVAGRGSVVINRSHFDGEKNDGMLTTFVLEGDRVLLTHYCEARNQPVLVASTIDDETNTVTFKFIGGTNIPTRDTGHMDSCVIRFIDADHMSSRWSWYGKGKEQWFEDVEDMRVK